jgi:hypothetical protein
VIKRATGDIHGTPTRDGVYVVALEIRNATGIASVTLTITIGSAARGSPVFTKKPIVNATADTAFDYAIEIHPRPGTTFTATPLPDGLAIDAATGHITGVPTTVGATDVTITATNATGVMTTTIVIGVRAAAVHRSHSAAVESTDDDDEG